MRVLGIDCGTERTGYGIIDSDGRSHTIVIAGTIRTSPRNPLSARLAMIAAGLREVISQHRPEEAAVEEVFHAVNAKSALKLAHVRGVALLVIAETGMSCGEYSPLSIKQSVVGYGRAEKQQVEFMVRSLLGPEAPTGQADACDALAVAICHATRKGRAVA
ncbi:MAG: crossover junction endodeoxyribonuclease RuvC [Acidobacteriia bacterium]|nr:crossover junction endodeoxyribonuclease RuvC [Terriglobia bacterium]